MELETIDARQVAAPPAGSSLAPSSRAISALSESSPAGIMLSALSRGVSPSEIREMLALQREWDADQARKSFNRAFAAFKADAIRIVKKRQVTDGPLKGKSYAELFNVVDAVSPALSANGLSTSWKLTKDDRDWIEVTCELKHVDGYVERVSMGGPPDTGGAKNAIQARASTISYLERYTLKAILGVAEGGEDDDGQGGAPDATGTPAHGQPPAGYPADQFEKNLPAWRAAIASNKKTAEQVIATVETKGRLTDEQRARIKG